MSTWHDNLPTSFRFMAPSYCETCGDYGVSLDVDLTSEDPSVNGEWGCTGGYSWYPEKSYTGARLYRELVEAGYDENIRFDEACKNGRPAWLAFLAEIKNDNTIHSIEELDPAPKPKPAWHDAIAVMADDVDGNRTMWVRYYDEPSDYWESAWGTLRRTADLRNVTPLIEAKVTDEMVLRALNKAFGYQVKDLALYEDSEIADMRDAIAAAIEMSAE